MLAAPLVIPANAISRAVSGDYAKGLSCERCGERKEAIKRYARFIERHPDHPVAQMAKYRMAYCHEYMWRQKEDRRNEDEHFSEARKLYKELSEEASSKHVRDAALYRLTCKCYKEARLFSNIIGIRERDRNAIFQRNIEVLEKFAAEHPDNEYAADALHQAAMRYSSLEQKHKSIETCLRLLQEYPKAYHRYTEDIGQRDWEDLGSPLARFVFCSMKHTVWPDANDLPEDLPKWLEWWKKNKHRFPK